LNLAGNFIKIKDFISKYYWIVGIPLIVYVFIHFVNEKADISDNKTETYGMVYGARPIYKQYSKRNYKYEFYYNGKKYTGTSTAYNSKNVENGNFYKVEFSDKNPEHSRMNFDLEYVREIKTNENGKIDTTYVPKNQKLRNEMKERLEKYKIELDTIKN
jgi:hypothetical protein